MCNLNYYNFANWLSVRALLDIYEDCCLWNTKGQGEDVTVADG